MISYAEAAKRLGINLGTLRSMVSRRQVPHIRISARVVVFDVADLDRWLDEHRVAARAVQPVIAFPQALDAEAALLGTFIVWPDETLPRAPKLEVADFYHLRNQVVFTAIRNLATTATPIDNVSVAVEVERAGQYDAIDGDNFIGGLCAVAPKNPGGAPSAEVETLCVKLRELRLERERMIAAGDSLVADTDDDEPTEGAEVEPVQRARGYVRRFATHADGVTLRRWRGDWYRWTSERGHYAKLTDEAIDASLYRDLGLKNRKEVGDVHHALIAADGVLIDDVELASWIGSGGPNAEDIAVCANGLLNLATGKLMPPTPRYFGTTALGASYSATAAPPVRWTAFLEQLWKSDVESVMALQEWFGYLLTPDTRQQKIMLLVGPKRSGKSTIVRVLTELLGHASVAAPTLATLGTNFGLQPLIGKTAANIADARLGGRSDMAQIIERLLSISGEDGHQIDRKHREQWTGKLSTRITVVSNELPRFADASDALPSRMLILELNESFYGREDVGLTNTLLAELPGILSWAIEGWQRLRKRGRFVQPRSSADSIADLEDLASPIAAWARERCNVGIGQWVRCDTAYADYKAWCETVGQQYRVSQAVFGRDVKSATQCKRTQQTESSGARVWGYAGMGLK